MAALRAASAAAVRRPKFYDSVRRALIEQL